MKSQVQPITCWTEVPAAQLPLHLLPQHSAVSPVGYIRKKRLTEALLNRKKHTLDRYSIIFGSVGKAERVGDDYLSF